MPDLNDGQVHLMQGSGSKPYELKNIGGVYSCSCPAWRNQSVAIERRTCKHLRKLRGDDAEEARIGSAVPPPRKAAEDKNVPPLLLAESWDRAQDLAGWWMSEKLDGVRAYWDGKQFLSRLGNLYHAPDWFCAGLPDVPLDGELWLGRKMFQRTVSIARRQDKSEHWRELRFVIFDAPGHDAHFEARMEFFQAVVRKEKPPYALAHPHEVCRDLDHLHAELARVEKLGGEGLMLRQPLSRYVVGRSASLLKVKSFLDAEARVLEHQPGTGRHKGRMGALFVEMAGGVRFAVGTGFSDAERDNPPPIGSIISFRYQELSDGGVPRFPSYQGVREDVELPAAAPEPEQAAPAPAKKKAAPQAATTKTKTVAPAPVAASPSATAATGARRFECVEGTASKFWEVSVQGKEMTTRWGRIGSAGQSKTKTFASDAAAQSEADKLVATKTAEGYVEQK